LVGSTLLAENKWTGTTANVAKESGTAVGQDIMASANSLRRESDEYALPPKTADSSDGGVLSSANWRVNRLFE
jgi:hypothetical protein